MYVFWGFFFVGFFLLDAFVADVIFMHIVLTEMDIGQRDSNRGVTIDSRCTMFLYVNMDNDT